jgi:hypothetical protein
MAINFRIWQLVVNNFNKASFRKVPSDRDALSKLAANMRSTHRKKTGKIIFLYKIVMTSCSCI